MEKSETSKHLPIVRKFFSELIQKETKSDELFVKDFVLCKIILFRLKIKIAENKQGENVIHGELYSLFSNRENLCLIYSESVVFDKEQEDVGAKTNGLIKIVKNIILSEIANVTGTGTEIKKEIPFNGNQNSTQVHILRIFPSCHNEIVYYLFYQMINGDFTARIYNIRPNEPTTTQDFSFSVEEEKAIMWINRAAQEKRTKKFTKFMEVK
jgi:hypothetical protein